MDSALAQWDEKESSTPDEERAALQQVVYNTAKTYLGKPERKHQDWFDPNDQELHTLMSIRDQTQVWGPRMTGPVHMKSTNGKETVSNSKRVVTRWSGEHFQKLLNVPGDIDHEALNKIPQRITKTSVDEMSTMDEMARAIAVLKDGKVPGEMEFLLKYGSTEETICSTDCTN
ncbi:hypothetical protein NP493_1225g00006 [Ridgeia piscesae]|uniref:Uncharacterized protein n=1 Tax=Ridgeia piscesae TaxID=27915 RepID=A0AAD9KDD7_RIDPI|nr:hypothetical protein NP493_1225g00006 [Ridgeia piscesae]